MRFFDPEHALKMFQVGLIYPPPDIRGVTRQNRLIGKLGKLRRCELHIMLCMYVSVCYILGSCLYRLTFASLIVHKFCKSTQSLPMCSGH